jgi:hypothetical protein
MAFFSLLWPKPAQAQEATIVGTVTDPTGAAVPNAAITVTNTDTGVVSQLTTGVAGDYVAADIHIGHYTVRAEAKGFKVGEKKDIVLAVGDRIRVDFTLELGPTQQQITVEATPVAVQTDSGQQSSVITGTQVLQLATNGRSIYTLATLVPGASNNMTDDQAPSSTSGDNSVSYNGLRLGHNLYLMDGAESYDRGSGGKVQLMPSLDALAEFQVMTSNYSADYGLSSAGTVALVFRSGTKDIHASAWEFDRNNAFDAASYAANASHAATPMLRFNTFGFNVGGPVVFPGYNKNRNKTFFFYNMEWRKMIQGGSITQTVPDTTQYGGDFSVASAGITPACPTGECPNVPTLSPTALSNLASSTTAPANLVKLAAAINSEELTMGAPFPAAYPLSNYLDPNAQLLLTTGIFPANNTTSGVPPAATFYGGANIPTNIHEELVRIDEHFSDKVSVFGHFADDSVVAGEATTMWSDSNVPTVGTTFANPSKSATVHLMHTISPTLLNEIAYNYGGNSILFTPKGIYQAPSGLTIPGYFQTAVGLASENTDNRIPGINISGVATYDVAEVPWTNIAADNQIRDDVSWVKGAHQLKMGGSWARYAKVQELFGNTQGEASFNGEWTGNPFADYLLGMDSDYSQLALQDSGHWPNESYALYIQDNWRATHRLTLNLGLRWDGIPHCTESNHRDANFYTNEYNPANAAVLTAAGTIAPPPTTPAAAFGASPNSVLAKLGDIFYLNGVGIIGENGNPAGMVQNHWNNWGPRIGFAYDLTGKGKTVIRGGFGIMYERVQGNDMYDSGGNEPFSDNISLGNVALSNPNLSLTTGAAPISPIPVPSINEGLVSNDYKNPVSNQYSIGIQQQLGRDSVLSIAYVGNQNRHQTTSAEINLPPESQLASLTGKTDTLPYLEAVPYTGFDNINMFMNNINSHYNGLQVALRSRLKNDLTFNFSFTWSRSIDPSTGGDDTNESPNPYDLTYNTGPSNLDRTVIGLVNFVYDMPFFRHSNNHALRTGLGGWQLSTIGIMETGIPVFLGLSGPQGANAVDEGSNRPDLTGPVSYTRTYQQWFTGDFSVPALGAWGDSPPQQVRQPGRDNWNICLLKNFVLSESRGSLIELRFESFNTVNHTEFKGVNSTYCASGTCGFGAINSVWDPRVFQFGVKIKF